MRKTPIEERFWAKVDKSPGHGPTGECWFWLTSKDTAGYGLISETVNRRSTTYSAHRISWKIHNGPIPNGLCVLHKCDNPACVNPDHLFLGTIADNNRDAIEKGRANRNHGNNPRILTADQVRTIRDRYRTESITYAQLGKEYGVGTSAIHHAVKRWSWRDVD